MKTPKRRLAVAGVISLALIAAACGDDDETTTTEAPAAETTEAPAGGETTEAPEAPAGDLEGSLNISGSSTVEPISIAIGNAFADANQNVAVTVQGPGTGDGFAQFCAGETDISDASRPIKAEEAQACADAGIDFIELKVAIDGLSPITSVEDTEVECLSFVDLYALLGPDSIGITNWADASELADGYAETVTDLGAVHTPYPDQTLSVTGPGEESGTFDSFVELVVAKVGTALGVEDANVRPDYTASPNDNVIIEGIGSNPGSLGWVGFAFVEENLDTIKPLQVDGGEGCVEPTPETIASGEYPIARDLYIYVSVPKLAENPVLQPFVDFYVNEGIATYVGSGEGQVPYVPLAAETVAETQAVWAAQETGSRDGG